MKQNMGSIDRGIRIIAAVLIGILYLTNQITGTAAIILGIIAVVFLLTGFISFCPLYVPLKISTKKEQRT
jgi:glucose uptake protein GlcU